MDRMMKNMPKFFQMADDMHDLTSYINDMRIIMIFLIVAGAVGGAIFLVIRNKKKANRYKLARKDDAEEEADGESGRTKSITLKNGHPKIEGKDPMNGDRVMNL